MHGTLSPYFDLYDFPTGRRLFALGEMRERAESVEDEELVGAIDRALEVNQRARHLEGQWRHARSVDQMARRRAAQIDNDLDRAVGALHSQLKAVAALFADEPKGRTASAMREELFPDGAGAITRMSFEEELSTVKYLLEQLSTEWGGDLADLEIKSTVEKLSSLADAFEDALAEPPRSTTWDEVREARNRGQEAMLHAVATVLGKFGTDEDDAIEMRQRLLTPIRNQNERIGELHKRQRGLTDVDPETGEPEAPDEAGADGASDSQADGGSPSGGEDSDDGNSPQDPVSDAESGGESESESDPDAESQSDSDGQSDGGGESDSEPQQ